MMTREIMAEEMWWEEGFGRGTEPGAGGTVRAHLAVQRRDDVTEARAAGPVCCIPAAKGARRCIRAPAPMMSSISGGAPESPSVRAAACAASTREGAGSAMTRSRPHPADTCVGGWEGSDVVHQVKALWTSGQTGPHMEPASIARGAARLLAGAHLQLRGPHADQQRELGVPVLDGQPRVPNIGVAARGRVISHGAQGGQVDLAMGKRAGRCGGDGGESRRRLVCTRSPAERAPALPSSPHTWAEPRRRACACRRRPSRSRSGRQPYDESSACAPRAEAVGGTKKRGDGGLRAEATAVLQPTRLRLDIAHLAA